MMAFVSFYFGAILTPLGFAITLFESQGVWYVKILGAVAVGGIVMLMFSGQLLLIAFIELMIYGGCEVTNQPHNWARRLVFRLER